MQYHEPLNTDALPLVDHLLGDLIATTESYESLQVVARGLDNGLECDIAHYPYSLEIVLLCMSMQCEVQCTCTKWLCFMTCVSLFFLTHP